MKKEALQFVEMLLSRFGKPALLWSSGKDSMALLHLVREVDKSVPLIFLREPQQPYRYGFATRVIQDWKIEEVHELPPAASYLCRRNDTTSIIHQYRFGDRHLSLPVDLVEVDGEPVACGLEIMQRPKGSVSTPWDLLFSGARSADTDPLLGDMPLSSNLVLQPGFPAVAFPMRSWSDQELWEYIESENVPVQEDRYHKSAGAWGEFADKRNNPDYLTGCVRCLAADSGESVECPLYKTVNGIGDMVPRLDEPLPFYIEKEQHA